MLSTISVLHGCFLCHLPVSVLHDYCLCYIAYYCQYILLYKNLTFINVTLSTTISVLHGCNLCPCLQPKFPLRCVSMQLITDKCQCMLQSLCLQLSVHYVTVYPLYHMNVIKATLLIAVSVYHKIYFTTV